MSKPDPIRNISGFTLIEILITMLISSIILGGIYATYSSQQKSYLESDQIAEMQQNLRAAVLLLTKDLREVGCDATGHGYVSAGFVSASIGGVEFTRDIAGDSIAPNQGDGDTDDAGEDIAFGFSVADDADGDGIVDGGGVADFQRNSGGGFQPVAEQIAAAEFNYILKDGTTTTAPSGSQLKEIRAVQVSLLARASMPDASLTNSAAYTTASGAVWGPFNDHFRRRFLSTTILCRNLGLLKW